MSTTPEITAELIAIACKEANPGMRFAVHNDTCVGVWTEEAGCFIAIYSKTIFDTWIDIRDTGLPLVNGERVPPDNEWVEIMGGPQP